MYDMHPVTLLTFGKIGNGKSATGNSVLGKQVFGRQELTVQSSQFNGRQIKVVDGLSVDTKLDENEVQELHQTAARAMSNGPFNAILIILKYGTRFTQADKDILRVLKLTFGKDVLSKHAVVVLTNGDVFEGDQDEQGTGRLTFEQWCSQQIGFFRETVGECSNRIVLFNNRERSDLKNSKQREALLAQVDSMWGAVYKNEDFTRAQESRDLHLLEAREPVIRQKTKNDVDGMKRRLQDIDTMDPQRQLVDLRDLYDEVNRFIEDLERSFSQFKDLDVRRQGQQLMRGCVQPLEILKAEIKDKLQLAEMRANNPRLYAEEDHILRKRKEQGHVQQLKNLLFRITRDHPKKCQIGIILLVVLFIFFILWLLQSPVETPRPEKPYESVNNDNGPARDG